MVAEASRTSSSWVPEKPGTPLKRQGSGGYSPEEGGARVPCSRGPAPDRTQEPSTAETHPEETPKDSGHDAPPGSGQCEGQPGAGLGGTVRGATPQRMDSLEETLWELEATLSQMGTAPSERPLGSLPPLPPRPKVAASSPVLPSCLNAPVSPSSELEGGGGCRSTQTAPVSHWPSLGSCHPPGSLAPSRVFRLGPRRLGSWLPPGPAHPGLAGTRAPSLLCIWKPTNKVFSLFPPPSPPLLCDSLSLSFSACASGLPGPFRAGLVPRVVQGAGLVHLRETAPPPPIGRRCGPGAANPALFAIIKTPPPHPHLRPALLGSGWRPLLGVGVLH